MNVVEIVFSPTGGTQKVSHIIGTRWNKDTINIDLSNAKTDFTKCKINKEDMVLIAMPSFGGRAPGIAIERLKKINGNGAKCTLICTYGNRAYEDTIVEMKDAANKCGFKVIAAISAIAQHSIMPQYAANRPDSVDKNQLINFADQITKKVGNIINIPGNRPYKKSANAKLVPKLKNSCIKCGLCSEKCPVQAIDPVNFKTDSKKCISCMRCVKRCPKNARKINGVMVFIASMVIKKTCSLRKENELFICKDHSFSGGKKQK